MKPIAIFLCLMMGATMEPRARAGDAGSEAVVIFNTRSGESREVAEHYAGMRKVPAAQVLGFDLPESENISREDFRERLQKPLWEELVKRGLFVARKGVTAAIRPGSTIYSAVVGEKIRYAVLCYGVPLRILEDRNLVENEAEKVPAPMRRNGAAVDSELACLPMLEAGMPLTGPEVNPLYHSTNASWLSPTNGLLLVARLDGPTAAIARGLVDKAVEAERNGLWGRAYVDLRGLTSGVYLEGDEEMARAAEVCKTAGFETVVDNQPGVFGAGFPMSQVAFYTGWYEQNVTGALAEPALEFMPGAFAYHLHSTSAATLRSTDRNWAGPLLARGATATMGCVDEPFIMGTPDMGVFFDCFVRRGFTYGEAAYSDQRLLSWQTTVVGDPLYRPFGVTLKKWWEELEGQTNSLMEWVELQSLNQKLAGGLALEEAVNALEALPLTKRSAVLKEKLAALNLQMGEKEASTQALQAALALGPTPEQRVRLELELADELDKLGESQQALTMYRQFITEHPNYPSLEIVRARILELARRMNQPEQAAK